MVISLMPRVASGLKRTRMASCSHFNVLGPAPLRRVLAADASMERRSDYSGFYYGAGLLFLAGLSALPRRWSPCAKRLSIVFLLNARASNWSRAFLALMWRRAGLAALVLLFPLLNLISLLASAVICIASLKSYAR